MDDELTQQPAPKIHCEAAAKLNFACHQNSYPFLRDLRLENCSTEETLNDLRLTLSSDPAFLKPKSWTVERVDPEGLLPIRHKDVELDAQFLLALTESVRGSLR